MAKVVLVSFANGTFYEKKRELHIWTAKHIGKFDQILKYNLNDVDTEFYEKNKLIFEQKKGVGLWLWKPYFLNKSLEFLNEGDILFHCDSASIFIKNVHALIQVLEESNQDIMLFELPLVEKSWTSPTVIKQLELSDKDGDSSQISASFFLIKKSQKSQIFLKNWLSICQNKVLLEGYSDSLQEGLFPYFKQHRYDQSLLSILAKKENITPFRDPSQYGEFPEMYRVHSEINKKEYSNSSYPTTILLLRTNSWYKEYSKYLIKKILKKLFPSLYQQIIS